MTVGVWFALTAVWAVLEGALSPRQRSGSWHAALSGSALLLVTLVGLLHGQGSSWGAVPLALGIGLRLVAILTLGERFTHAVELLPGHRIEDQGIYRWMSHPSEVGLLLIGAGTGALLGVAWLVPVMLLPMVIRIRAEERLLASAL